jgi:DNA protecting protein DprA
MIELAYLQLQAAKGIGPAKQRKILQLTSEMGKSLEEVISQPASQTLINAGLSSEQVEILRTSSELAHSWASRLKTAQIKIIGLLDNDYPLALRERLGVNAPPIIAVWGNMGLLEMPAVGFCGSRDASTQGLEFTTDAAQQVAQKSWAVVSGNARGIDETAHRTALQNGGTTIIVAPSGILDIRLRDSYRELVNNQNTLVISEFQPNARWSIANAMTRNKTICALSNALIIVESGLEGGTFEAGNFALKSGARLFVADYASPSANAAGNQFFLQRGAESVRRSKGSGRTNLTGVFDISINLSAENTDPLKNQLVQGRLL